jgi:anti-sigma factor RsiW
MKACDRYLNAINELVDGTLGPIRRSELELHLESCEDCRALADDLQAIAETAGSLDPIAPPAHVWREISAQLQREGRVTTPASSVFRNPTWLALAAALLLAIAGSLIVIFPRQAAAPATVATADPHADEGNAADDDPVKSVKTELALTDQHVKNAVDAVTKSGRVLDPSTIAVIDKELATMNQAGDNILKAIQQDPQDVVARQGLYDLLRQKIRFVQNTIALMNEMRQGDAAGAAQIVDPGKS